MAHTPTIERYWQDRQRRLRAQLAQSGVGGLFIVDRALLSWLGLYHIDQALILPDALVTGEMKKIAPSLPDTVGIDPQLSATQFFSLQEQAPHVVWKPIGEALARLLAVKDQAELVLLRQATRITRGVFERMEAHIREGISEVDLLYHAHAAMLELEGNGFAFDPSIGSGKRSSLPWAGVTSHKLRRGEAVLVDLGVSFRGYRADMARSYRVEGEVDETWERAKRAVEETFAIVATQARPGITCQELHQLCEHTLAAAGFGQKMRHALGHGIGLRIHEVPFLAPGCTDTLEANMVIALEPGLTLDSGIGVRYEEVVLVTEHGGEVLV